MAKHQTKYNITNYYNKYLSVLESNYAPLTEERKEIFIIKIKLYKKILPNLSDIKKIRGLAKFLSKIELSPVHFTNNEYGKYSQLVKRHLPEQLAKDCIAIMAYTKRDKECMLSIQKILIYKIPAAAYKLILDTYYTHIANWVLQGYIFYIGKHLGKIYIEETHKNFINEFGNLRGLVDRGTSFVILEELAKSQEDQGMHTLYSDYKVNKYYTRMQFIHLMKSYTYSPDKPDLPKWIVYHTDEWIPYFRWGNRDNSVLQLKDYTFKPTSYINTPLRNKSDILEAATSIDDILNCNELGAKDKMFLIKKFDNNFYKYTRHDIP
jgi:hypothetical protein